jgi:hypothetical protein
VTRTFIARILAGLVLVASASAAGQIATVQIDTSADLTMSGADVDLNGNDLLNMVHLDYTPTDTAPSATEGNHYYDDSEAVPAWHNGSFFVKLNRVEIESVTGTSATGSVDEFLHVDSSAAGGTVTITLEACDATNIGGSVWVWAEDVTEDVIVDGNASETINGATSFTMNIQYETARVVCVATGEWARF